MGVGQEPEVTDPAKAIRQHMQKEAANEFAGIERHHLGFVARAVVLPAEANTAVVTIEKSAVGDGNAMGVAAEIVKNLLRPSEGPLGIDHPLDLAQSCRCAAKAAGSAMPAMSPKKLSAPVSKEVGRRCRKSRR